VRVNASELRAQVIGEGGNLGVTQAGRVEFALAGGRVNTDAIDNSGGVDCSDREVNIKILLNAVVEAGDLTEKQRNSLLVEMTDDVAALVLKDNYEQAETLSLAEANASSMLDVHQRFLTSRHGATSTASSRRCRTTRRSASASASTAGSRGRSSPSCSPTARSTSTTRCSTPTSLRTRTCQPSSSATSRRRCPSASEARCARTGSGARSWPPRW
jgi:hypothetical protein